MKPVQKVTPDVIQQVQRYLGPLPKRVTYEWSTDSGLPQVNAWTETHAHTVWFCPRCKNTLQWRQWKVDKQGRDETDVLVCLTCGHYYLKDQAYDKYVDEYRIKGVAIDRLYLPGQDE